MHSSGNNRRLEIKTKAQATHNKKLMRLGGSWKEVESHWGREDEAKRRDVVYAKTNNNKGTEIKLKEVYVHIPGDSPLARLMQISIIDPLTRKLGLHTPLAPPWLTFHPSNMASMHENVLLVKWMGN